MIGGQVRNGSATEGFVLVGGADPGSGGVADDEEIEGGAGAGGSVAVAWGFGELGDYGAGFLALAQQNRPQQYSSHVVSQVVPPKLCLVEIDPQTAFTI